jgi:DNA repair ATPase RecN
MTNYQSRGYRYYVCAAHRQRGACENTRFHRMDRIESAVEDLVLGLLRDPDTFRKRIEEQAETMRRSLRSGESVARALRKELDALDERENNLVNAIASLDLGTRMREKFRDELDRIQDEWEKVQARLEEVSDTEEQVRRLQDTPHGRGISGRSPPPHRPDDDDKGVRDRPGRAHGR